MQVNECGQELVPVLGSRIIVRKKRSWQTGTKTLWLRRGALEKLREAASLLPPGICLYVDDAWRSRETQREIKELYKKELLLAGQRGNTLKRELEQLVQDPDSELLPHLSGGSVDLSLWSEKRKEKLDMGYSGILHPARRTDFWLGRKEGEEFQQRRNLLTTVMAHAGWSNYPEEWWHFDIGNFWHHSRVGGCC